MKLGRDTGSLVNHLLTSNRPDFPATVGDGATICYWTDRSAATVVKVTRTQVHVQEDAAIRTDANGMSESQSYRYEPRPEGPVIVFRKTKRGWRAARGGSLVLGVRNAYHDYSF